MCTCAICGKPADCEWKTCTRCYLEGLDPVDRHIHEGGDFDHIEEKIEQRLLRSKHK